MHLHLVLLGQRLVGGLVAVAAVLGHALVWRVKLATRPSDRICARNGSIWSGATMTTVEFGGDVAARIVIQVGGEDLRLESSAACRAFWNAPSTSVAKSEKSSCSLSR
jgi:hypothetical protein